MPFLLVLAGLAAAAPSSAPSAPPWPSDAPVVFAFTYGQVTGVIDAFGKGTLAPWPGGTFTWTCRAKPATKAGKQQMTCDEPGLGSVWMMWGPGRELLSLDIDEDAADLGDDRHHHRVAVLAGLLELWPAQPRVDATWEQGGTLRALRVAATQGNVALQLTNRVTAVDGPRVSVASTGAGTYLLKSVGSSDARVEVGVAGEAEVDTGTGLLLRRTVRVWPERYSVGTFGTLGHEVSVRYVP